MGITFNEDNKVFHLQAKDTSYIMQIVKDGYLAHLYWGKKIRNVNEKDMLVYRGRTSFSANPDDKDKIFSLDTLPQEYPAYGNTDFRTPAYQLQLENGSTITDLRYESYTISKGKPKLNGLPATYVEAEDEAETLEIVLIDSLIGLRVHLLYTVFEKYNVITRSARFVNEGNCNLKLLRGLSMSLDFMRDDFDFLHLNGSWARERHIIREKLTPGMHTIESRRGASSHEHNPFIAIISQDCTEEKGEAYGLSLVYSGNFLAQAEINMYKSTRVSLGINPFDFSWLLEPGQDFQTPEVVMVYSSEGLGAMSRTYHKLYRTRLCRGRYRDKTRPILINNWEATYFDFDAEKLINIAKEAKKLGIELFVLDDGWFGKRNSDDCSLGDWVVDKNKLPDGLKSLGDRINDLNMKFGLWFEPEMVSPDSDLYRAHPDWCLHVPERTRSTARTQLILDLSREDVCDYIAKAISQVLSSAPISYVKWDMNRNMTEVGSKLLSADRQRETAHRYILGLYKIMDKLTDEFEDVLFEGCSGGGGRFDPGILYYMPQIWTSDDSDAVERLKIQYGTSILYPASTMGAHVSAVPNHQVGRNTPLKMRGDVAMSGNFGYELDLTKFTEKEKKEVKEQVMQYKELRALIQFGDMFRLVSPFEGKGNETAWMYVSEDKNEAMVAYFRILAEADAPVRKLRLIGLDPDKDYLVSECEGIFGGDELMYSGITIPFLFGDYQSVVWKIKSK
ncbi:alpha-galactosidase [Clostridium fungisolvens]|uniref:Alpha-galactosidase n=1 Tax=Clostridium fungisolvens TaxID=1604897 RepID=A0A6V8SDT9_9CLOT|nr:alpha-galactosidase [Clostridium fungisolvens]GFP75230.1 Alpha-galactosidase AgaA [Clostridium fungisolvens]